MHKTFVFIHGLESTAQGTKGQYFSQNFPDMIVEDFTGDLKKRMEKLNQILAARSNLIIVGSSYGGLMAVQYAMANEEKIKKLILMAPAINLPEFHIAAGKTINIPVILYHGTEDDVVDPYKVRNIASRIFPRLEHHFVKDDHPLHKTFASLDWMKLLAAD
ncbi:MAG: alpha/beta fold hydrolase [Smithella sp.]|nr:alpha/beta fold hydrolase [Smithella sp.]